MPELAPTIVSFPRGETVQQSRIVHGQPNAPGGATTALLVALETPFHPVDHTWPDQPGDVGSVTVGGATLPVVDSVTAAVGPDAGELLAGPDITGRRGDPAWTFVVAHVVQLPTGVAPQDLVGEMATLSVDPVRRSALSAGHTACHLMALALNKHTRALWGKQPRRDSLGNPDFDQTAIAQSRIDAFQSMDRYRLGKSLRKAGFDTAALLANLTDVREAVDRQLEEWLATGAKVTIEVDDPYLSARRYWTCDLPDGPARLPCGGTHVKDLSTFTTIRVSRMDDTGDGTELTIVTQADGDG